jgi:hypothetical protein
MTQAKDSQVAFFGTGNRGPGTGKTEGMQEYFRVPGSRSLIPAHLRFITL